MQLDSKEIVKHIDKIIDSVKNNTKIIFSTKDENTTHYNIVSILDYKFTLKCEKKMVVNEYEVIIDKEGKTLIQYKLPFFIGKMIKGKLSEKDIDKVDKGYLTSLLEKAKSWVESSKDDIIDLKKK